MIVFKVNHCLLKYCILHNTHCVKLPLLPRILVYFSDLLAFKYVNLIFVSIYVAFNDLDILKILTVM